MDIMRLAGFAVVSVIVLAGCVEAEEEQTGQVALNLIGQAGSGNSYRLRNAIITVQGPQDTIFFNTEDNPDRVSLSAEVPVGSYFTFLQEGWVLERLNPDTTTHAVQAQLISPNPSDFYVHPNLSTLVALRFRAGTDVVELDRGAFDIVLEVEELPPPSEGNGWFFANYAGSTGTFDPSIEWDGSVSCPATCGALGLQPVGARFICNLAGTDSTEGCTPETDGQYGATVCGSMVQDGVPMTQNGYPGDCTSSGNVMDCVTGTCWESVTYHALECQCQGLPQAVCGNGAVEGDEQCDDGNSASGDGCDSFCQDEPLPPGESRWFFANYAGSTGTFDPSVEWNGTVSCPATCGALGLQPVGARFICNLAGSGPTEGCTPETDGQYGTANCGLMVQDGEQQTQNGNPENCASLGGVMGCVMSICEDPVTYHALECQCQGG